MISITVGDAVRVPMSKCRSCSAPIFFARTTKNKLMPVDIEPTPDGTLVIVDVAPPTAAAYDRNDPMHAGKRRFQSHFASCKHASSHRKPRV